MLPLLFLSAAGHAHHSLTGNFITEEDARQTVAGVLVKLEWRNPHVIFFLEVSANDKKVTYRLESDSPRYFAYRGFHEQDFRPGADFAMEIYPSRDSANLGWARVIRFPDGRTLVPVTGDEAPAAEAE